MECVIATLSIYIAYKGRVPGAKERDASETRVNYWACAIVKPKFGWEVKNNCKVQEQRSSLLQTVNNTLIEAVAMYSLT